MLTPEEQEKLEAYRAEAKAVREAIDYKGIIRAAVGSEYRDVLPKPSDLLPFKDFLKGFAKKLDEIFGEEENSINTH